jgi:putative spermidine/putrescine transport system substrate-binding protein
MARKTLTRRQALIGAAGTAAFVAAKPAIAQGLRFDGVTLRVATFGGGWEKALHDFFGNEIEKLGGKVEYLPSPPRDALARLIAARGREAPFDLCEMADNNWIDFVEGGFVQKINLDNIPNRKELASYQFDEWKVASWYTQEGILYNKPKLAENGIPVPTRYKDLLHPKLAGKISLIDISQAGAVQFVVGASYDDGGSEKNIEPGINLLKQIKAHKYWKLGAESLAQMGAEDAWVATMHAGFAVQSRRNNKDYGFVHPIAGKHRGISKEGWLGIVKGSKNARAAEFFINGYVGAAAQENLAKRRGVVPINPIARERLGADPLLKEIFLLGRAEVDNMLRVDFKALDQTRLNDMWTRAVAAR